MGWALPAAILDTENLIIEPLMQELLRGEGSQEAHCGGGGRAGGEKCPLTVGGEPRMASPSHEPPGTLHTWDSWSSTHAATNPSTPTGTKWEQSGGPGCSFP